MFLADELSRNTPNYEIIIGVCVLFRRLYKSARSYG
jgi:hypothetical protein